MIIHIYDAPPHGEWKLEGSDPEKHDTTIGGSKKHKCCCCSDLCRYSKKKGKGWAKMFELMKFHRIKYQGLVTNSYVGLKYFDNYMKEQLGPLYLPLTECGKE